MGSRAVAALVTAALTVVAVTGCGPGHSSAGSGGPGAGSSGGAPEAQCGRSQTPAGVPVEIDIQRGPADCTTALAIERAYTRAVASGKVAGNGGGAPVTIKGWVCQGFNTPKVLATGQASACRKGSAEILAILPTPTASSAP